MQITIYNSQGEEASKIEVSDSVFNIEPNEDVVFRAVMAEMTNRRQGNHSTKTRGKVSGGGRKPWKQKGTGRARHGSIRSPIWRGGGVSGGPKPKDYQYDLPKKMRQLARRSVLSQRAKDKELMVIQEIKLESAKTKSMIQILKSLGVYSKKVALLPSKINKNVALSVSNLSNVFLIPACSASTYDLLNCEIILFDKKGITELNQQLTLD